MFTDEKLKNVIDNMHPIGFYSQQFGNVDAHTFPRISTGYKQFDIALNGGLANELYIMAAETSTGKSAIAMDIAQNISASGINVLYFSMEMGKNEFIARGISNISYEHNMASNGHEKEFTTGNILYYDYDYSVNSFLKIPYQQYSSYTDEYTQRYGEHLYIIEAGFDGLTAKDIANMAYRFKTSTGLPVVVFVDYLQILRDDSNDRKTKMDNIVTTLKSLASQIGMPVFALSSIGRQNYNGKINTASFKESGDTEYTGGVLIGWNWLGVTDTNDKSTINIEKKRCNRMGYRRMQLEILKFRNSKRDYSVNFKYFPAYNHFEEQVGPWDDLPETDTY